MSRRTQRLNQARSSHLNTMKDLTAVRDLKHPTVLGNEVVIDRTNAKPVGYISITSPYHTDEELDEIIHPITICCDDIYVYFHPDIKYRALRILRKYCSFT